MKVHIARGRCAHGAVARNGNDGRQLKIAPCALQLSAFHRHGSAAIVNSNRRSVRNLYGLIAQAECRDLEVSLKPLGAFQRTLEPGMQFGFSAHVLAVPRQIARQERTEIDGTRIDVRRGVIVRIQINRSSRLDVGTRDTGI